MSPPLVDHTAIDYHAPRSDPTRVPHTPAHACILRPVGSDDEQLLFPEGWKHSLRTRTMLILSPRSPCTARTPHTTQRSNAAEAARKGPCPRSQKRFVLLGKHIAREAGDGLRSSMGPFPYHLVHISLGHPIPPSPQSVPICSPSLLLIHLMHVTRCIGRLSTMEPLPSARLLGQGTTCPLRRRLSHPYAKPPHAAHDPLLSCDGGRPSRGRATLLLSGRLEAYDKFRWRAGGCRGSLAAVLCVVGPQGRQIAPPLAHALPHPPFAHDRQPTSAGSFLVPVPCFRRRFVCGRSSRREHCVV